MAQDMRHQCLIYAGPPSKHLPALANVIRQKIQDNYRCLYLNSPPMVAGIRSYLSAAGIDVEKEIEKTTLLLSSDTTHRSDGVFDIELMMGLIADAFQQSQTDGYKGLWASGDMTWEFGPDKDLSKLVEYEWRLEEFFRQNPALQGICQYHVDTFPVDMMRESVLAHPAIFINDSLTCVNPHFHEPRSYGVEVLADEALDAAVSELSAAQ